MKIEVEGKSLELVQGDITDQDTDAIANAANSGLRGGGGVDGAIHRAGGPDIMKECRTIGGCPTGSAVITTAGNLKAKHVIHAVGPIWRGGGSGERDLLAGAYRTCLELARKHELQSISFPSISTGVYGYPVGDAAKVALSAAVEHLKGDTSVKRVLFVLFDEGTFDAYADALETLA
jgi:O-acetyl-ADP-ribose deacetylase (regulator of RNase III)